MITENQIRTIIVDNYSNINSVPKSLFTLFQKEVLREKIKAYREVKYSESQIYVAVNDPEVSGVSYEMKEHNKRIDLKITELEKQLKEME